MRENSFEASLLNYDVINARAAMGLECLSRVFVKSYLARRRLTNAVNTLSILVIFELLLTLKHCVYVATKTPSLVHLNPHQE